MPLEKVYPLKMVEVHLFDRNDFVPTIHNNQIVTQGYFDTIKGFVDAVEKTENFLRTITGSNHRHLQVD